MTQRCCEDRQLHGFEYGYLYKKYDLGCEEKYRNKLIPILADAGKSIEEAEAYGIGRKEYRAEKRRKLLRKVEWKLTHIFNGKTILALMILLFLISLLPLLGLSGINHAAGDDLGYGRLTHQAWLQTHSLGK